MAKDNKRNDPKESIGAEILHKSRGLAVSDEKDYNITLDPEEEHLWFVAILEHQKYTSFCCKFIEEAFNGCQCYVPRKEELHVYPNRTKRMVNKYVIPRLVFVTGIDEEQAYHFAPKWPHVNIFMPDRARERTHGHVALARINHPDMVRLQNAINGIKSADDISFTTENLAFDEQIEVVSGDLKGLEGGYYKDEGKDYVVFMLGKMGNIKVRVSIADCSLKKT